MGLQETARLSGAAGLRAEINANGSLRRLDCAAITLSLFVGNEVEGGPTNLYLRRHAAATEWTALLGPLSPTRFQLDAGGRLVGMGRWQDIEYSLILALAQDKPAWFWHVRLENQSAATQTVDLTYVQDIALASYGAIRLNEFYVSQYLDHTPLRHTRQGVMVATRQNQAADGRFPWSLIGSLREGASFATDALQFHGLTGRAGAQPLGLAGDLPGTRLQHEHSMVVIRDAPISLAPQSAVDGGFFGLYVPDHPEATSSADAERAAAALALPEAKPAKVTPAAADAAADNSTLFSAAPLLDTLDLDTSELQGWFGSQWRHEEIDAEGTRLSFFHGAASHVVLRAK